MEVKEKVNIFEDQYVNRGEYIVKFTASWLNFAVCGLQNFENMLTKLA